MKPSTLGGGTTTPAGQNGQFAYQGEIITKLEFDTFFHPHVCALIETLNNEGVAALLSLDSQNLTHDFPHSTVFAGLYAPTSNVDADFPREDMDFRSGGAYSIYNWELFFHIPLLVATRLSQNQQFADAQRWLHYIFNPTDTTLFESAPQCYWKFLPFSRCNESESIELALWQAGLQAANAGPTQCQQDLATQLAAWEKDPFNPHLIARLRQVAYQKCVVMKYIDNLIAWGDYLYGQDTREAINEATQYYILAYQILGPSAERIPNRGIMSDYTYHDLVTLGLGKDDPLSDPLVALENEFPYSSGAAPGPMGSSQSGHPDMGQALYFCVPPNDQLLGYWDTVADRLFKIRNCMNIEGVVRDLPLFAPPIDPALLVRAAAMGVDLSSVLSDINAATPHYRFTHMHPKAVELCADVKALGNALFSVLQTKDAERLAALRAGQETDLLKAVREVKTQQITEAQNTLDGLSKSKEMADARYSFYSNRPFLNEGETAHLTLSASAAIAHAVIEGVQAAASPAYVGPTFYAGIAGSFGSPLEFQTLVSGVGVGASVEAAARVAGIVVELMREGASISATMGGYQRRADEWGLQADLAKKEQQQIEKQIAAAQIRLAIAETDLLNQDKQIGNASAVENFLREKYTNAELYDWMVSQSSAIFFQSYKLAYDMAKRAEQCFRFERGLTTSDFINFGYWDSLRQGLLSGEQLYLDLKRLEIAYLDQNAREYEITKHVSLVLHDPIALITLKQTGRCEVELPETLFDSDYPGHYMRRIKSVSITLPCVVGPYTSINCTLTLLTNKTRVKASLDDDSLETNFAAMQSIATSHAQNDSGLFELNFRDERYLPFEGAGAVSRWRIDLPRENNAFDFNTLTDVVLHLKYTAREGGDILRNAATKVLNGTIADADGAPLMRLFSSRHESPATGIASCARPTRAPPIRP
jgi:hypothetical protein